MNVNLFEYFRINNLTVQDIREIAHDNNQALNLKNTENDTPFHIACRYQSIDVISYLIKEKAKVCIKGKYDNTPLHIVSLNIGKLNLLINTSSECINTINIHKKTPLHYICEVPDFRISIALFMINTFTKLGRIDECMGILESIKNRNEIINILMNICNEYKSLLPQQLEFYDYNNPGIIFFIDCINEENKTNISHEINNKNDYGCIQLLEIYFRTRKTITAHSIQTYLDRHKYININSHDNNGDTLLHYVCADCNNNILEILLNNIFIN
jgi:ankyrin repeat protein